MHMVSKYVFIAQNMKVSCLSLLTANIFTPGFSVNLTCNVWSLGVTASVSAQASFTCHSHMLQQACQSFVTVT